MAKPKLALYWAASCGGCEIAQLQIGEKILKLAEFADIVFWPVAIDVKYKDVMAMPDTSIDVCLFNGGINYQFALFLRCIGNVRDFSRTAANKVHAFAL